MQCLSVCRMRCVTGYVVVLPCIDRWVTVDLRTKAFSVPPQMVSLSLRLRCARYESALLFVSWPDQITRLRIISAEA